MWCTARIGFCKEIVYNRIEWKKLLDNEDGPGGGGIEIGNGLGMSNDRSAQLELIEYWSLERQKNVSDV